MIMEVANMIHEHFNMDGTLGDSGRLGGAAWFNAWVF